MGRVRRGFGMWLRGGRAAMPQRRWCTCLRLGSRHEPVHLVNRKCRWDRSNIVNAVILTACPVRLEQLFRFERRETPTRFGWVSCNSSSDRPGSKTYRENRCALVRSSRGFPMTQRNNVKAQTATTERKEESILKGGKNESSQTRNAIRPPRF